MKRYEFDREGARNAAAARTLVATAFVAGFAAPVWVYVDFDAGGVPAVAAAQIAPDCAAPDCLHVPAGDPSVPAANRVFVDGAQDVVPPLPTF